MIIGPNPVGVQNGSLVDLGFRAFHIGGFAHGLASAHQHGIHTSGQITFPRTILKHSQSSCAGADQQRHHDHADDRLQQAKPALPSAFANAPPVELRRRVGHAEHLPRAGFDEKVESSPEIADCFIMSGQLPAGDRRPHPGTSKSPEHHLG